MGSSKSMSPMATMFVRRLGPQMLPKRDRARIDHRVVAVARSGDVVDVAGGGATASVNHAPRNHAPRHLRSPRHPRRLKLPPLKNGVRRPWTSRGTALAPGASA